MTFQRKRFGQHISRIIFHCHCPRISNTCLQSFSFVGNVHGTVRFYNSGIPTLVSRLLLPPQSDSSPVKRLLQRNPSSRKTQGLLYPHRLAPPGLHLKVNKEMPAVPRSLPQLLLPVQVLPYLLSWKRSLQLLPHRQTSFYCSAFHCSPPCFILYYDIFNISLFKTPFTKQTRTFEFETFINILRTISTKNKKRSHFHAKTTAPPNLRSCLYIIGNSYHPILLFPESCNTPLLSEDRSPRIPPQKSES